MVNISSCTMRKESFVQMRKQQTPSDTKGLIRANDVRQYIENNMGMILEIAEIEVSCQK